MKKLLLVVTTFFFAFSLSGCFLEPDDIEEVSEKYCTENPESDICQGENVGDLEDDVVRNIFSTILEEHDNSTNDTFCETYFSITNLALLDQCREDRSGFFPNGYETFNIVEISKDLALDDEDIYKIYVTTDDITMDIVFTIYLTELDGVIYISQWDYEEETVNPETKTVSYEDARSHFVQFIEDYNNENIDSSTICQKYFPNDEAASCIEAREEAFNDGITYELDSFDGDGDLYTAGIFIKEDTTALETIYQNATFSYDSDGNIIMTFTDEEDDYSISTITDFYKQLLTDFQDPTLNINDVCNYGYDPDNVTDCLEGYQMMIDEGYTIELIDLYEYEDHFMIELRLVYSDYVSEIKLEGWFFYIDGELKVRTVGTEGNEESEYLEIIKNMISDYNDHTIDTFDFCITYFFAESIAGCMNDRDEAIYSHTFVELDVFKADETGLYRLSLHYYNNDSSYTKEFEVNFVVDEDNNIKMEFFNPYGENIEWNTAQEFLDNFVIDFNSTMPTTDFVDKYIDDTNKLIISQFRNDQINMSNFITSYYLYYDNEINQYSFEFIMTDNATYKFIAHFSSLDPLLVDLLPLGNLDEITHSQAFNLVTQMIDSIYNHMTPTDICNMYFDDDSFEYCFSEMTRIIYSDYEIYLENLIEENNYYTIELKLIKPDSTVEELSLSVFFYRDNGQIKMSFANPDDFISTSDKTSLVWMFADYLDDPDTPIDEVCNMAAPEVYSFCTSLRQELFDNDYTINPYMDELLFTPYYIDYAVYNNQNNIVYMISFEPEFYFNSDNEVTMSLHNPVKFAYYVDSSVGIDVINNFVITFNDQSITHDEFCDIYGQVFTHCTGFRQGFFDNNEQLKLEEILEPLDSKDYIARLYVVDLEDNILADITWQFYIYLLLDDTLVVEGWQSQRYERYYDINDIQTLFNNLLVDYFDPTITNDQIAEIYGNGWYFNGIIGREDLLAENYILEIGNVSISSDYEYHGSFTLNNNYHEFNFTVFHDVAGNMKLQINFDYIMPSSEIVELIANNFVLALGDETMTNEYFCENYFNDYEYDLCLSGREEYSAELFASIVTEVYRTDEYAYFKVEFRDPDGVFVSERQFNLMLEYNILKTGYITIFLNNESSLLQEEAITHVNYLVTELNNGNIDVASFCLDFAVCENSLDGKTIDSAFFEYISVHNDFYNTFLQTEIHYIFTDGTEETHLYEIIYETDNGLTFTLLYEGKLVALPDNAERVQSINEIETLLNQFILDVTDSTITANELCETYFGGSMRDPECLEGRNNMFTATVTYSPVTIKYDELNDEIYSTTFTVDYGTETEEHEVLLVVFYLPTTSTYSMMFLEPYDN